MEIIITRKKLISMSIISTSLNVRAQPSPRFHVEAWLPFRNREMDSLLTKFQPECSQSTCSFECVFTVYPTVGIRMHFIQTLIGETMK